MGTQVYSIYGTIGLDETPTVKAMKNVAAEAKTMKAQVEGNMQAAGKSGAEGFLRGLKERAGRRSVFGESIELLAGAGAVAAIGIAAEKFGEFGEGLGKLSGKFREGKTSGRDLWLEFGHGIPVIGSLVKGFEGMAEAFTGWGAAAKREEEIQIAWKKQQEQLKINVEITKSWDEEVRKLQADLAIIRAPNWAKPGLTADEGLHGRLSELKKKYDEDAVKAGTADALGRGPSLATIQRQMAQAKKAIADSRAAMRPSVGDENPESLESGLIHSVQGISPDSGVEARQASQQAMLDHYKDLKRQEADATAFAKAQTLERMTAADEQLRDWGSKQKASWRELAGFVASVPKAYNDGMAKEIAQTHDTMKTAGEKYKEEMKRLDAQHAAGLTDQDYGRARNKAGQGLLESLREEAKTIDPFLNRRVQGEEVRGTRLVGWQDGVNNPASKKSPYAKTEELLAAILKALEHEGQDDAGSADRKSLQVAFPGGS